MRFLRESAVERVHARPDDAARDQQGDLRRMSVLDWLMTPPPDVAVRDRPRARRRRARRMARRHAGRGGACRRAAAGRAPCRRRWCRPTCLTSAWSGQAVARALGAARRAHPSGGAGRARHGGQGVAAAARKGARQGGGPARDRAVAGAQERCRSRWSRRCSASARGRPRRGRPRVRRRARPRGRRPAVRAGVRDGQAPHAGIVDLATFGVLNSVVAGGGAPAGDWLLVHVAGTYITLAVVRGEHLIFFRHRSDESEGTLADLIHQTAMYYEDRLKGSGYRRASGWPGMAVDGRTPTRAPRPRGAAGRSASSTWTHAAPRRWSIASAPRRS